MDPVERRKHVALQQLMLLKHQRARKKRILRKRRRKRMRQSAKGREKRGVRDIGKKINCRNVHGDKCKRQRKGGYTTNLRKLWRVNTFYMTSRLSVYSYRWVPASILLETHNNIVARIKFSYGRC